jgi:hypothetical protein
MASLLHYVCCTFSINWGQWLKFYRWNCWDSLLKFPANVNTCKKSFCFNFCLSADNHWLKVESFVNWLFLDISTMRNNSPCRVQTKPIILNADLNSYVLKDMVPDLMCQEMQSLTLNSKSSTKYRWKKYLPVLRFKPVILHSAYLLLNSVYVWCSWQMKLNCLLQYVLARMEF